MSNILGISPSDLKQWCSEIGESEYRADQILKWIHQKSITDFSLMTNLSKSLRDLLQTEFFFKAPTIIRTSTSNDGCLKWLIDAGSGNAVESVLIPEIGRRTLCISSQAGCAVNCPFCLTGKQGFSRNLSIDEIIGQLWLANSSADRVSNIVFMGMGEPLLNYDSVVEAIKLIMSDFAYGISRRKITVSTSGIVPKIDRLSVDCPVSLAISLHAGNDSLRNDLVPINKKYPLKELLEACKRYQVRSPREFITFEIVMLRDINDSTEHAKEVAAQVLNNGIKPKFNLIPFNSYKGSKFETSSEKAIKNYKAVLQASGYTVTIRKTRGEDVLAACGQLAGEVVNRVKLNESLITNGNLKAPL